MRGLGFRRQGLSVRVLCAGIWLEGVGLRGLGPAGRGVLGLGFRVGVLGDVDS